MKRAGLYINGQNTGYADALGDRRAIEDAFSFYPVELHHNPPATEFPGLRAVAWAASRVLPRSWFRVAGKAINSVFDSLESAWNRRMGRWIPGYVATTAILHVKSILDQADELVIFAHSQGTAIAVSMLWRLADHKGRIKVHLFAPVNTVEPEGWNITYWINDEDPIPGTFWDRAGKTGKVNIRSGRGHALVADYLNHLSEFPATKKGVTV